MLYQFVKKDGDVKCVGDIDSGLLDQKLNTWLSAGWQPSTVEEYVEQVVNGSKATAPAEAKSEPVAIPEEPEVVPIVNPQV